MNAIVVYHSRTGITQKYGNEIHDFLKNNNLTSKVLPITEVKPADVEEAEIVLLGCWTSGLFFFLQHPDKIWKKHALELPDMKNKKVGYFTTYKTAAGSMFKNMSRVVAGKLSGPVNLMLKSRNGSLSEENKKLLNEFIGIA